MKISYFVFTYTFKFEYNRVFPLNIIVNVCLLFVYLLAYLLKS